MDAKQAHMPSAPSDTIMNKLGGAVVEAHLHEDDAAMHRDQQGPESGMNGTSGEELNNLTETVASGLLAMQGRQADINAKVSSLWSPCKQDFHLAALASLPACRGVCLQSCNTHFVSLPADVCVQPVWLVSTGSSHSDTMWIQHAYLGTTHKQGAVYTCSCMSQQCHFDLQIDGMTAAGLEFLDMIKQSFIERMARWV